MRSWPTSIAALYCFFLTLCYLYSIFLTWPCIKLSLWLLLLRQDLVQAEERWREWCTKVHRAPSLTQTSMATSQLTVQVDTPLWPWVKPQVLNRHQEDLVRYCISNLLSVVTQWTSHPNWVLNALLHFQISTISQVNQGLWSTFPVLETVRKQCLKFGLTFKFPCGEVTLQTLNHLFPLSLSFLTIKD